MPNHDDASFDSPPASPTVRSPSDLIHLIVGLIIWVVGLLSMMRLVAVVDRFVTSPTTVPPESELAAIGLAIIYAVGIVVPIAIALFAAQRWAWSRLAVQIGGMILSWISVSALLRAVSSGSDVMDIVTRGSLHVQYVPLFAATVAAVVLVGPVIPRRWGAAAWTLSGTGAVIIAVAHPGTTAAVISGFGAGLAIGAGLLLVVGTPSRHPDSAELAKAMRRSGIVPTRIRVPDVDARGSAPFIVTIDDGSDLFVKVVTVDERSSDIMFRTIRGVFLKSAGDEVSFSSLRRAVEHEAFVSMAAERNGVRTPSIRGGGTIGSDPYSVFLAFETVDGQSLDGVSDETLTDEVLAELWNQVAIMRSGRLAHRDLRLANVMLDSNGLPWIIDFGFSELSPTDLVIDSDIAELIASTSIKVGADRAVDAAEAAVGRDAVCAAAGRMQLSLLSGATRAAIKADPVLFDAIIKALEGACGGEHDVYLSAQGSPLAEVEE